jgi:hypothetical protein
MRATSEYRLPTRNPAHPDYPQSSPSHPGYASYPYVDGYIEETYDSEYEVSDDSDDEMETDSKQGKVIMSISFLLAFLILIIR